MRVSPGIEHHAVVASLGPLQGVDQLSLDIRLEIPELHALKAGPEPFQKLFEGLRAVHLRIAPSLQIEVRAVENQYLHIRIVCFVRRSGPRSAVHETKIVIIPGKFDTFVRQLRNND